MILIGLSSNSVTLYPTLIAIRYTRFLRIVHLQFWANFDPQPKGGRDFQCSIQCMHGWLTLQINTQWPFVRRNLRGRRDDTTMMRATRRSLFLVRAVQFGVQSMGQSSLHWARWCDGRVRFLRVSRNIKIIWGTWTIRKPRIQAFEGPWNQELSASNFRH